MSGRASISNLVLLWSVDRVEALAEALPGGGSLVDPRFDLAGTCHLLLPGVTVVGVDSDEDARAFCELVVERAGHWWIQDERPGEGGAVVNAGDEVEGV